MVECGIFLVVRSEYDTKCCRPESCIVLIQWFDLVCGYGREPVTVQVDNLLQLSRAVGLL